MTYVESAKKQASDLYRRFDAATKEGAGQIVSYTEHKSGKNLQRAVKPTAIALKVVAVALLAFSLFTAYLSPLFFGLAAVSGAAVNLNADSKHVFFQAVRTLKNESPLTLVGFTVVTTLALLATANLTLLSIVAGFRVGMIVRECSSPSQQ